MPALIHLCLFLFLLRIDYGLSLRVSLEPRSLPPRSFQLQPRINTSVALDSASNTQYLANITVGGYAVSLNPFRILMKRTLVVHLPL
jgi:hypothetical protein